MLPAETTCIALRPENCAKYARALTTATFPSKTAAATDEGRLPSFTAFFLLHRRKRPLHFQQIVQ